MWAPCPGLAAVLVIDGHDEALAQEQAPTWHATTVAAERARRAGVPCVVVSACPTLELLAAGPVRTVDRRTERQGWAAVEVIDRRADDPRQGLYSERLVALLRAERRVVCVLNRTGRARLLVCGSCGEVARCERCGAALISQPGPDAARSLLCPQCGLTRPQVCAACGSTRLGLHRIGVTRAREELEVLAGRRTCEVTAASSGLPDADVLVGTEAVLRRLSPQDGFGAVAFIDFDQELLAARVRAGEEALALLAQASRLAGGRRGRVLVQTRIPDHPAIRAAVLADPGVLAGPELELRQSLRLPPVTAVALVSGPAAPGYVEALRAVPLEVIGPDGDRWLVKADDAAALADGLAAVPRPAGRAAGGGGPGPVLDPGLPAQLVHGDGRGRGHVEAPHPTHLREERHRVAGGQRGCTEAAVLVTHRQAHVEAGPQLVERDGVIGELQAEDGVAVVACRVGRVTARPKGRPGEVPLRAHGQLSHLGVSRRQGVAAQVEVLDPVGRGGADYGAHVVRRLHPIEQQGQPAAGPAVPFTVEPLEVGRTQLPHGLRTRSIR